MAYTAQQLQGMGYYGYAGWNDAAANADFMATHGAGKGGPSASPSSAGENVTTQSFTSSPVQSAIDIADSLRQSNIKAAQPAIDTLNSNSQPLVDRYNKLIESIKGRGQTQVQQAGVNSAVEFGKRGIPTSSGAYDQYLQNQVTPINQATDQSVIGAEGELADKQAAIKSAIASLQSGAGNVDMNSVLNILSTSKDLSTPKPTQTQVVNANGRQLLVDSQTGKTIQDLGASPSSSSSNGLDLSSLASLFGGNATTSNTSSSPSEPKPTNTLGPVSAKSPQGQWAWDYSTKNWYPVGK